MTEASLAVRVLIVEDSTDDAELATRALRNGGLVVEARIVADRARPSELRCLPSRPS